MSSGSSDSEDGGRRRGGAYPPPPPPQWPSGPGKPKGKSKKKKPLPPQEQINKIWQKFSAPKFSKATTILPFVRPVQDPASKSKSLHPQPSNLLVSEDFERAVLECRARVQKLVKECKRVNMRYRDPSFDIDWDLKTGRGQFLNGLMDSRFDLSPNKLLSPTNRTPKAVKRVHEIFDKPTFMTKEVSPADIIQGSLGNCWLLASLTALANMEIGLQRICVEFDTKIGIYGFVFHRDGQWIISIIDDKLYLASPDWDSQSVQRTLLEQIDREDVEKEYRKTYQTGSQALFFARCRDQNETWLPLLEKAFAKAHGDYSALAGGWIGEGVEDLTGGVTTELLTSDILDTDAFWTNEILKVNKEFLFGCSTGLLDGGHGHREGIVEGHAYVIMEARELSTGVRLLKLRNPWGKARKGIWEGPWSDGSKEFTPEAQRELNHKFGNDSVFWISFEDMLRKYQHFDRTRLFMDSPDWRITQQWISVEVPWHAEFEQRFRLILTKESPVVLVLSQLDERYYYGLDGQYIFRLQFRLHEVNTSGEEDYILRSHGNYLMDRSVVTELQSLAPGTYSVFVKVVAERSTSSRSVEDIVKSQTRDRRQNSKLAQVGAMYDDAHRKGAVHLASREAERKAQEKARARAARIATRRKQWEMKHRVREADRKQFKKNCEKAEKKEAKRAAASKEQIEKGPKDQASQTETVPEVKIETENKSVQTEDQATTPEVKSGPSSSESIKATEKSCQTDDLDITPESSLAAPGTPNSDQVSSSGTRDHTIEGNPPPPPFRRSSNNDLRHYSRPPPRQRGPPCDYEEDSSASPISDYEDLYSEDDIAKDGNAGPAPAPQKNASKDKESGDEDDEIGPWNAIAMVGFRVYSKDEGLELRVFDGEEEVPNKPIVEVEDSKEEDEAALGDDESVTEAPVTKDTIPEDTIPVPA